MKSWGGFYQTTRMTLIHLKFAIERAERESQLAIPESDRDGNRADSDERWDMDQLFATAAKVFALCHRRGK